MATLEQLLERDSAPEPEVDDVFNLIPGSGGWSVTDGSNVIDVGQWMTISSIPQQTIELTIDTTKFDQTMNALKLLPAHLVMSGSSSFSIAPLLDA